MTRIVTTHYRYKRPPKKRQAVALEVPAIANPAPAAMQPLRPAPGGLILTFR